MRRLPKHARLLGAKAAALKNWGRIGESIAIFESAVVADPRNALTRHNQAVTLRAACRFEEACSAFEVAQKLGAEGAAFHANWAAAATEAGRIDEAADLYRRAIAADPTSGCRRM